MELEAPPFIVSNQQTPFRFPQNAGYAGSQEKKNQHFRFVFFQRSNPHSQQQKQKISGTWSWRRPPMRISSMRCRPRWTSVSCWARIVRWPGRISSGSGLRRTTGDLWDFQNDEEKPEVYIYLCLLYIHIYILNITYWSDLLGWYFWTTIARQRSINDFLFQWMDLSFFPFHFFFQPSPKILPLLSQTLQRQLV